MTRLAGVAQSVALLFWMVTAFYAVLASQTFAYEQFLKPELVPGLALWARSHPFVCAGVLALYVGLHWFAGTARDRGSRPMLQAVVVIWAATAAALFALPPLASLTPGPMANLVPFVALTAVALVAAVDVASAPAIGTAVPSPRHAADLVTCVAAAIAATVISAGVTLSRGAPPAGAPLGLLSSVLLHLALFATAFLLLTAGRAIAASMESRRVEALLATALMSAVFFVFLWRVVLSTIVANPSQRFALAAAFGVALGGALAARGLRSSSSGDDPVARVLHALSPRLSATTPGLAGWLLVLGAFSWSVARASATADWNFVVANVGVVVMWTLVLATFVRFVRVQTPGHPMALVAATGIVLALNVAWTRAAADDPRPASAPAAARWTDIDPAARFLASAVRHHAAVGDADLVGLLQAHTNVPASVPVAPVEVSLGAAGRVQPYRPHIFLFVVDSLRRDYLGAYNTAVGFTPSLDQFARENVAFRQAFTRYGATGLSVPSIWTGGMLLHKQYTRPFAPMNTLARLLSEQQYRQWIGMDHILDTILPASDRREPLDTARTVKDFRICRTLDEVRARLRTLAPGGDPVFVYSLPQDIHISAIAREGAKAIDADAYTGFYAPVASRVKSFDACFGAFIADLKERNLYDDSIVIVTADHGDSLGEEGRMGHAYTLYPEIVRIPLLMHLPARLRDTLVAENEGPVFSTDISPTLHALLGIQPAQPRPFFGRPLFRPRGQAPRGVGAALPVIAASYGAVYGALLDRGRTFYVLDTINLRDHAFALDDDDAGARDVTASTRQQGRRAIRETVEGLADFYKFGAER